MTPEQHDETVGWMFIILVMYMGITFVFLVILKAMWIWRYAL